MSRPIRILARNNEDGHERWVERAPGGYWIIGTPGQKPGCGRFLAMRFDNVRLWAKSHGYQLASANISKEEDSR